MFTIIENKLILVYLTNLVENKLKKIKTIKHLKKIVIFNENNFYLKFCHPPTRPPLDAMHFFNAWSVTQYQWFLKIFSKMNNFSCVFYTSRTLRITIFFIFTNRPDRRRRRKSNFARPKANDPRATTADCQTTTADRSPKPLGSFQQAESAAATPATVATATTTAALT